MYQKRSSRLGAIAIIALTIYLISFGWNGWFSETMARHQLLQLPLMLLSGVAVSRVVSFRIPDIPRGLSVVIFTMFSLTFWMLPRSVDMAVIYPLFNRLMHLNMLIAGFLIHGIFTGNLFEIKLLFLGMTTAMLIAVGVTLRVYDLLLCSSFDIPQQKTTGYYMLLLGGLLLTFTLFSLFRISGKKDKFVPAGAVS